MNRRIEYYHAPESPVATSIVVSTSVCAFDQTGALLLIRRADNDQLSLPGGVQQIGETVSHAAEREVKEETGINVEITELLGIYSDPGYVIRYPDGTVGQEFSICFRGRPFGGQVRGSVESSEVHWIQPEHLSDVEISAGIRVRIEDALQTGTLPHFT